MAGRFELIDVEPNHFRILLVDAAGDILATSRIFGDKSTAAAAVMDIREHAATAHLVDRTSGLL